MLVCGECGTLWGVRLAACGRCRSRDLHRFGSEAVDWDHPRAGRYLRRRDRPAPARPSQRDPVSQWRAWAVTSGLATTEVVASMSKTDLVELAR